MGALAEQTVLVVGGSSGIGLAAAKAAMLSGARVIVAGRSQAKLTAASADFQSVSGPGSVLAVAIDMLDAAAVAAGCAALGTIDHLVLTAVGDEYSLFGSVDAISDEQVERSFDKQRGYLNVARVVAPAMRGRGSVTLLSGAGAFKPPRGTALAAAANGAIVSLGRALAVDLAPVRVNVVMPGAVDTPLHGDQRAEVMRWAASLPARHTGQPEDIAQAILFLMTNPYVTGHTLVIDGGYLTT